MASRVDKFAKMARIFYSLGHETRLAIVMLLGKGEMNVTALCKELELGQSLVSEHLRQLRLGGLVTNRRDGKQIFYAQADLSKHRMGKKAELTKRGSNAAKFGPAELILPKK